MATRSERILAASRVPGLDPRGDHLPVRPDFVLLPEYALALVADRLDELGGPRIDPSRLLVVADHFALPSSIERAEILTRVQRTVERYGWQDVFRLFDGIAHQLMLEDPRLRPGMVVVGADSHTVTAGAAGAWAAGFGSHDLLHVLRQGFLWLRPSPQIAVRFHGAARAGVEAKDLILEVFRRLGPDGFHWRGLEFFDDTVAGLSPAARATICNMVVDGGAETGLFAPTPWGDDDREGDYAAVLEIDLPTLEPLVARPGSPFEIAAVAGLDAPSISQAYLGSCNGGRLEDFAVAAALLKGRRVAPGVKAIAIPSSREAYLAALRAGHIETLVEAGFVIGNPSCGPCGGIDKGILGAGDVCVATMNRNFRGRMGSPEAEIWLAGAAVVAASAVAGRIVGPEAVA